MTNVYSVLGNFSGNLTTANVIPDGAYTRNLGSPAGSLFYKYLYCQYWQSFYNRIDMNNNEIHFYPTNILRWKMNANFYPASNNLQAIGTSALRMSNVYSVLGNFSGNLTTTNILPATTSVSDLGSSSFKWKDIYSLNAVTVGSDIYLKKNIVACPLGLEFISSITPVQYAYTEDEDDHIRFGFVAQDVLEKMPARMREKTSMIKMQTNGTYGMIYQEMIGPLIQAIKDLKERVVYLEEHAVKRPKPKH